VCLDTVLTSVAPIVAVLAAERKRITDVPEDSAEPNAR
jgi:hypothetical protein